MMLVSIFIVLLSLRLDNNFRGSYEALFAPLYVLAAVALCFLCFILPGLMHRDVRLYKETFLMIAYYTCGILAAVNISLKLDDNFDGKAIETIIPLMVAGALHLVLIVGRIVKDKGLANYKELLVVLFLHASIIMSAINFDFQEEEEGKVVPWTIIFIPAYLLTLVGMISLVSKLISQK